MMASKGHLDDLWHKNVDDLLGGLELQALLDNLLHGRVNNLTNGSLQHTLLEHDLYHINDLFHHLRNTNTSMP